MVEIKLIVVWQVLTALITAHAKLTTAGTALESTVDFYVILLVLNWVALTLDLMLHKEKIQFVDYNENLPENGLLLALGAVILVFICATASASLATAKTVAINVPILSSNVLSTSSFTSLSFITSILWNFALIANSEETTKLVAHNGIYLWIKSRGYNDSWTVKGICAGVPILFWAVLHAYIAYVGPYQWSLVAGAFVSGLIIFAVLWHTKSLLAAVVTHGTYNVIVVTAVALGWMPAPQARVMTLHPLGLILLTSISIVLTLYAVKKNDSRNPSESA